MLPAGLEVSKQPESDVFNPVRGAPGAGSVNKDVLWVSHPG